MTRQAYHVTWVTHNSRISERILRFRIKTNEAIIFDEQMRNGVYKYLCEKIERERYQVLGLNVLNDHVHCVLVCDECKLERIVKNLKGYSAFMLNSQLGFSVKGNGRQTKIWAKGYSHTFLQTEKHISNALEYTRNNHLKHGLLTS